MKDKKKLFRIALLFLLAAAVAGGWYIWQDGKVTTDNAAIEGTIVTLSPKVQGYVKAVHIKDNQVVKAGDVLVEIDPADYQIKRDRAAAVLSAAKAAAGAAQSSLATTSISAPSGLEGARAQVASAQANWEKAAADRQRMESLFREGACSQQQWDQAVATEASLRAALEKSQADARSASTAPSVIATAQSTTEQLAAQVRQAEVELAQAEQDLANTKIIAPVDGRITKRSVELGNYVQAGQQLGSLVGTELWVVANFKETQLKRMHPGQTAEIRIDAYPGVTLKGRVDSLQAGTGAHFSLFPAENATGNFVKVVQRVPVKIVLEAQPESSIHLGPGMSVEPTVFTEGTVL